MTKREAKRRVADAAAQQIWALLQSEYFLAWEDDPKAMKKLEEAARELESELIRRSGISYMSSPPRADDGGDAGAGPGEASNG